MEAMKVAEEAPEQQQFGAGCPYCNHCSGEDEGNAEDFQEFQDFEEF